MAEFLFSFSGWPRTYEAGVLMHRLSYPTETVESNKIARYRIVLSFKDSPRKPLRRRPKVENHAPFCDHKSSIILVAWFSVLSACTCFIRQEIRSKFHTIFRIWRKCYQNDIPCHTLPPMTFLRNLAPWRNVSVEALEQQQQTSWGGEDARLRRIVTCIAMNQKIRPILYLYLYRVRVRGSDTIQYQGGPAGFSL